MRDLPRVVAESRSARRSTVVVLRKGKEQTVKVTLGRLEEAPRRTAADRRRRPTEDDRRPRP